MVSKNKLNGYEVNIDYNSNSGLYIAYFYFRDDLVQKIASPYKNKLESLKRKFYNGKLIFNEPAETRPTYVNKTIY